MRRREKEKEEKCVNACSRGFDRCLGPGERVIEAGFFVFLLMFPFVLKYQSCC